MNSTKRPKRALKKPPPKEEIKPLAVYTVEEAAGVLCVSRRTVYRLLSEGQIKTTKGPGRRITGRALLRYLGIKA